MANKFKAGMLNFVEVLNQMWDAFAAGPYNAVPLTGGTMTGPLIAPSVAAVRAPALSVNVGSSAGWWKVGRLDTSAQGSAATLRVAGTTSYAGDPSVYASNGMLTTVLLRVDNDGVVRGSFYSVGASTNSTVQLVRVGDDGTIYLNVGAFFTLDVYLDTGSWIPQPLAYVGYDIPANSHNIYAIYGLKLGNLNVLTLTATTMTSAISFDTRDIAPATDNAYDVGSSSRAYRTIYARTGTINTSDARLKRDFRALTPQEIAAACDLGRASQAYRWVDAVLEKGSDAREHIGPTVQAAVEIMQAHGLDPTRYGFICYDAWPESVIEHPAVEAQPSTAPGIPAVEARDAWIETIPAGDRYAFRYAELSMFIAAGQATQQDALEQRIAALEAA